MKKHLNEEYLPLVMEEIGEVLQAMGKLERFGIETVWREKNYKNYEALALEVGDLLEVIDRLGLDPDIIERGRESKREKLKTYGPEIWSKKSTSGNV